MARNWATSSIWTVPAALVVALLLVPGVIGATPVASTTPATSSGVTQWAYGTQDNLSFSLMSNSTTYTVTASFDYAVVFTQTNTSSTTFELEVQRTLGFNFVATYSSTVVSATLSGTGFEADTGFGNFTENGSVYVNGTAVPALAVINTAHTASASLVEAATVTLGKQTATAAFNASLASQGHATYAPDLGIVPDNVSAGESWNATSVVSHVGAVQGSYTWSRTSLAGRTVSGAGSLNANTTVTAAETVNGTDLGPVSLRNGLSGDAIVLTVTGPLQPRDGVLWMPGQADLFDIQHPGYTNCASGVVGVITDRLDWVPHVHGHLGLEASETGFTPQPDASAIAGTNVGVATGGASPAAGPSSAQEVQAQPESVGQAQSLASCLQSGQGVCSSASTGSGPLGSTGGAVVVAAVVIAVIAVFGVLLLSRRRAPKSPAEPVSAPETK
jgi:hypothetical protein